MPTLEEKLEEFKALGHYSVTLYFGESTGMDDLDIPTAERRVKLFGEPVGVLGGARRLWVGKYAELLDADWKCCARIENPPPREVTEEPGYYIWGTDDAVESILGQEAQQSAGDPEEEL